jgi:beta-phosphoglucomutase-like phosphatase (HAD superfamily)
MFEGTLVDSVPQSLRGLQEALEQAGLDIPYATLQLYTVRTSRFSRSAPTICSTWAVLRSSQNTDFRLKLEQLAPRHRPELFVGAAFALLEDAIDYKKRRGNPCTSGRI